MVFQQPLLLKWRRILDNVLLPAEILGLPMAASRARARDLLALVGLTGNEDKYPYELSGGMQQRAAIARALVHDPKLILMDEPFGALDALTREKMNLELLRIWKEAGKTIVFVTHGISEAVFLGTRVVVLTAGPARMADNFESRPAASAHARHQDQREVRRIHPPHLSAARDGVRNGAASSRHHHERRHRPHGDEPAPDPLDPRDPDARRRRAQEWRSASCPTRSWSAATTSKVAELAKAHGIARVDDRPRRGAARIRTTRCSSTPPPRKLRAELLREAIAAGKHIYCEKPIADNLEDALDRRPRRQDRRGIKHGVVQDKLFLPGLLKLQHADRCRVFRTHLSVRGEFGYWVFEGDWQPAQRPSWNYRKKDGGGIILDMLCHWRYVLDNLFGEVKSVSCLGATHIPKRWDEDGKRIRRGCR